MPPHAVPPRSAHNIAVRGAGATSSLTIRDYRRTEVDRLAAGQGHRSDRTHRQEGHLHVWMSGLGLNQYVRLEGVRVCRYLLFISLIVIDFRFETNGVLACVTSTTMQSMCAAQQFILEE